MATLVVWTLLDYFRTGRATAVGAATGIVVGLVAITPAAGFVSPASALLLGALAAFPSYFAIALRSRTRIDDSLDVFAGHGVGGLTGALLTGVLAQKVWNPAGNDGLLFGNPGQLGVQALGCLSAAVYAAIMTFVILKAHGLGDGAPRGAPHRGRGHGREPARRRGLRQRRRLDPGAARGGDPVRPGARRSPRKWPRAEETTMKLIVAIIRPDRLNEVLEALYRAEVRGLTVSRVLGHGGETERVETYRGTTVKVDLQEKVRLEIGVSDSFVEVTVQAILGSARTGDVGDGKIFVLDVEQVYRIRTGREERGGGDAGGGGRRRRRARREGATRRTRSVQRSQRRTLS